MKAESGMSVELTTDDRVLMILMKMVDEPSAPIAEAALHTLVNIASHRNIAPLLSSLPKTNLIGFPFLRQHSKQSTENSERGRIAFIHLLFIILGFQEASIWPRSDRCPRS